MGYDHVIVDIESGTEGHITHSGNKRVLVNTTRMTLKPPNTRVYKVGPKSPVISTVK